MMVFGGGGVNQDMNSIINICSRFSVAQILIMAINSSRKISFAFVKTLRRQKWKRDLSRKVYNLGVMLLRKQKALF